MLVTVERIILSTLIETVEPSNEISLRTYKYTRCEVWYNVFLRKMFQIDTQKRRTMINLRLNEVWILSEKIRSCTDIRHFRSVELGR